MAEENITQGLYDSASTGAQEGVKAALNEADLANALIGTIEIEKPTTKKRGRKSKTNNQKNDNQKNKDFKSFIGSLSTTLSKFEKSINNATDKISKFNNTLIDNSKSNFKNSQPDITNIESSIEATKKIYTGTNKISNPSGIGNNSITQDPTLSNISNITETTETTNITNISDNNSEQTKADISIILKNTIIGKTIYWLATEVLGIDFKKKFDKNITDSKLKRIRDDFKNSPLMQGIRWLKRLAGGTGATTAASTAASAGTSAAGSAAGASSAGLLASLTKKGGLFEGATKTSWGTGKASKLIKGASAIGATYEVLKDAYGGYKRSNEWLGEKEGRTIKGKTASTLGGAIAGTGSGLSGALANAGKGAMIGSMFGGPIGMAIGAAVGGIFGAIGGKRMTQFFSKTMDFVKEQWGNILGVLVAGFNFFKKMIEGLKNIWPFSLWAKGDKKDEEKHKKDRENNQTLAEKNKDIINAYHKQHQTNEELIDETKKNTEAFKGNTESILGPKPESEHTINYTTKTPNIPGSIGYSDVYGSDFGFVSNKYESGGKIDSINRSDTNGTHSYGLSQFNEGSLINLVKFLNKTNPELYGNLLKNVDSRNVNGGAFETEWKKISTEHADEFKKSQLDYRNQVYYKGALNRLAKQYPQVAERIANNRALSESFLASSVQTGKVHDKHFYNPFLTDGKFDQKKFDSMSDEDFIKAIYKGKLEGIPKDFNKYLKTHNDKGLRNRYDINNPNSEANMVLKLLHSEEGKKPVNQVVDTSKKDSKPSEPTKPNTPNIAQIKSESETKKRQLHDEAILNQEKLYQEEKNKQEAEKIAQEQKAAEAKSKKDASSPTTLINQINNSVQSKATEDADYLTATLSYMFGIHIGGEVDNIFSRI